MSVTARLPIVAIVATIIFVPVIDKAHHILGHSINKGPTYEITCTPGEPIPSTPLTVKIHVAGKPCRAHPGGHFRLEAKGHICPKNLWWQNGQCVANRVFAEHKP